MLLPRTGTRTGTSQPILGFSKTNIAMTTYTYFIALCSKGSKNKIQTKERTMQANGRIACYKQMKLSIYIFPEKDHTWLDSQLWCHVYPLFGQDKIKGPISSKSKSTSIVQENYIKQYNYFCCFLKRIMYDYFHIGVLFTF